MDRRSRMGRLINIIFRGFVAILPHLLRMIWIVVEAMGAAFICLLVGIPETTDRLATMWTDQMIKDGLSEKHRRSAYVFFRAFSVLTVLVGWVCLSYVTVFVIVWLV